jgi:hypothetical protein
VEMYFSQLTVNKIKVILQLFRPNKIAGENFYVQGNVSKREIFLYENIKYKFLCCKDF